jgi:hypothetical protein
LEAIGIAGSAPQSGYPAVLGGDDADVVTEDFRVLDNPSFQVRCFKIPTVAR